MENNSAPKYKSTNEDFIDIRAILSKYLKKWYWFLICVFICVAIAYVYLKITQPKFQVQTSILLRDDKSSGALSQLALLEGLGVNGAAKEVEDEIQILTSKTIISQVIESLNIETEYYVKKGVRSNIELYPITPIKLVIPEGFNDTLSSTLNFNIKKTKKGYEVKFITKKIKEKYLLDNLSTTINTPYGEIGFTELSSLNDDLKYKITISPLRNLTENYSSVINVSPVNKKSNAINISTISATPEKAKVILDKLIELYNQDVVNDKNLIASNTATFIDKQIVVIEQELSEIEAEVENYKKEKNLTDISVESELFLKSVSEYDIKLGEVETQINLIEYINNHVNKTENQYSLIPANLGINDEALTLLIKEYNDALLERMKLLRTTNELNPVISQIENMLAVLKSSIITSIGSIKDGLNISKQDLLKKDSQFAAKIKNVPTQEREYIEIKRKQEVTQTLYLYLLQKRKENELNLATTVPPAKILDKAYTSLYPVSPKRMTILFIALIIGLAVPLIIIYLQDLLNNRITDKKEYQRLVKVPFLGSIGINKTSNTIVVEEGRVTPIIEMFRQLRTNLQFMVAGKKNPVILVASSVSGEGKSFVSINLALSLTLMNKKIVLLGLDIRNPMLGEYMKIPKDNQGITIFLSNPETKIEDIVHKSPINQNLYVIQGGPIPPNPTELLMSPRLDELINELKKSFDYIIIDSAPVAVVSDTFQLNRFVDNTVYVSRQGYTSRELTTLINEIYDSKKLNNMSVVLNGTDDETNFYGYNHKKYLKER